jgi:hypothetical protein
MDELFRCVNRYFKQFLYLKKVLNYRLYLMLVFLSVQIFFMWIDVDKSELRSKISSNESILKNSIITVFFIGTFLIIHKFIEGTKQPYLIIELFDLIGFIFVVYFVYNWHLTLKACSYKKKPASDFILDACLSGNVKIKFNDPFLGESKRTTFRPLIVLGILSVILALFLPVSTIYFAIIIGFLFVPPALALASTMLGGFLISKELHLR